MSESADSSLRVRWLAVGVAAAVLLLVGVRLAWLGDDAYITLRSVENWVAGNGMRWNVADRVQVYTHPLWMLLMSIGRWLTGELYFTVIALSLLLSMVAVVMMLVRARTVAAVVAVGSLLVAARAFGDYMTSGLETPLTFVLLVLFVGVITRTGEGDGHRERRYGRAVLLASLLATNRMDLALLCLAPVLSTMPGVPFGAMVKRGLLGASPFLLWLLFAGMYYGSPFPVTAHAKAFGVGIPAGEIAEQGLWYLLHTAVHDPALLGTVVVSMVALLFAPRARFVAVGAICYVAYVVKVGGGFMQGRFLLPPFVVLVAALTPQFIARGWRLVAPVVSVVFVLMWFGGVPNFVLPPGDDQPLTLEQIDKQRGVADERRMYYRELGMLSPTRRIPVFGALEESAFPGGREEPWWLLNGAVGSAGFGAGAEGHIIDPLLCDPLVARLPAEDPSNWRIGHVLRRIPEGYYESLAFGENRIHHPGLRRYYEALRTLTRAPVFDGERLAALWGMAVGSYNADLRAFLDEHYYDPPRIEVPAARVSKALPIGSHWFDQPSVQLIYEGGIAVRFDGPQQAKSVQLQVVGMLFRKYHVRFVRDGEVVGSAYGTPLPPAAGVDPLGYAAGVSSQVVQVPSNLGTFDTLWIDRELTPESHTATGPPGVGAVTLIR